MIKRSLSVLLCTSLATGCATGLMTPPWLGKDTAAGTVRLRSLLGPTLAIDLTVIEPMAIKAGQRPMTRSDVAQYRFELYDASNDQKVDERLSSGSSVQFAQIPDGTYYLKVVCLNASNVPICQEAHRRSLNEALISGGLVSYTDHGGTAQTRLLVRPKLNDAVGGDIPVSLSGGPFNSSYKVWLRKPSGEVVASADTTDAQFRFSNVPDGTYEVWAMAHDAGKGSLPRRATLTTLANYGSSVSGNAAPSLDLSSQIAATVKGNGEAPLITGWGVMATAPDGSIAWLGTRTSSNPLLAAMTTLHFQPVTPGTYFGKSFDGRLQLVVDGNNGSGDFRRLPVANGHGGEAFNRQLAIDNSYNIYVIDQDNDEIWLVPAQPGTRFGLAVTAGQPVKLADANSTNALSLPGLKPTHLAIAPDGHLYVSDHDNHRLYRLDKDNGTLTCVAGDGNTDLTDDGVDAATSPLSYPSALTFGPDGQLYISERGYNRIRVLCLEDGTYFGVAMIAGNLYTVAGDPGPLNDLSSNIPATGARLQADYLAFDTSGNLLIDDRSSGKSVIRLLCRNAATLFGQTMSANRLYTLTASGTQHADGIPGADFLMASQTKGIGFTPDGHALFQPDWIEGVRDNGLTLIGRGDGSAYGRPVKAGWISLLNLFSMTRRPGDPATGVPIGSTIGHFTLDADGNSFIPDPLGKRVLMIPKVGGTLFGQTVSAGKVYTLTGDGIQKLADGLPVDAWDMQEGGPVAATMDPDGNLLLSLALNDTGSILLIPRTTGTHYGAHRQANRIYPLIGPGTAHQEPGLIYDLKCDPQGNVYLAELTGKIWMYPKVAGTYFGSPRAAGTLHLIAGGGADVNDGAPALAARIVPGVLGIALDASGNLYFSESGLLVASTNRVGLLAHANESRFGITIEPGRVYTVPTTQDPLLMPAGLATDPIGNLYVRNAQGNVRLVTTDGMSYTIAGGGAGNGDSGEPTSSALGMGIPLVRLSDGRLLTADGAVIREIQ